MKIEVDKDKLKKVCDDFGLDINKTLYYTNVVVVPGSKDDLYVTLDKNCNVIDVREYDDRFGGMYNYFEGIHTCFNDDIISDIRLTNDCRSLDSLLSFGTIIKLTDKYSDDFNGNLDGLNEDQKNLISYLSFLRQMMNRYFMFSFQMKSYRDIYPDINSYIKSLIFDLNRFIDGCLSYNIRPDEYVFIDMSGAKTTYIGYTKLLSDIIDLLMKSKGYKQTPNKGFEVEKMNESDELISINDLVSQLKNTISEEKKDVKQFKKQRKNKRKH